MNESIRNDRLDQLSTELKSFWRNQQDQERIAEVVQALNKNYDLEGKIAREPEVEDIIKQMAGRLANVYPNLYDLRNKRILDIACGSNTSKLPASFSLSSLFGSRSVRANHGYTALFEPWFCRMLLKLEALPVGVDFGDLDTELFIHYKVDLGVSGALDFLPDHSFDGIQDSRLFGSPEFTAKFPSQTERYKVGQEIVRQERRLLKPGGIIIHSDAMQWVK
jgi:SAM-dependent methyltransferase